MLEREQEREGRVGVSLVPEYLEILGAVKHPEQVERMRRQLEDRDIVLHGFGPYPVTFPYPGPVGRQGPVIKLWRGQAEQLVGDLLKKLAPEGELPTDAAELLDFVSEVLRNGSRP